MAGLVSAALVEEIGCECFDAIVRGMVADHAAGLGLRDEAGSRQKPKVVCERRGWHIEPLLDIADDEAVRSCAHQCEENFEARFRANRGKALCCLDKTEVVGRLG